jgi:hypothetical protein
VAGGVADASRGSPLLVAVAFRIGSDESSGVRQSRAVYICEGGRPDMSKDKEIDALRARVGLLRKEVKASRSESEALRRGVTAARQWIAKNDNTKATKALDRGVKTADGHRTKANEHRDADEG